MDPDAALAHLGVISLQASAALAQSGTFQPIGLLEKQCPISSVGLANRVSVPGDLNEWNPSVDVMSRIRGTHFHYAAPKPRRT